MQLDAIDHGTDARDRTESFTATTFFTYCALLTDLEASCSSDVRTNALIVQGCVDTISLLICLGCIRTATCNGMSWGRFFRRGTRSFD
jgi:hypothetical protein